MRTSAKATQCQVESLFDFVMTTFACDAIIDIHDENFSKEDAIRSPEPTLISWMKYYKYSDAEQRHVILRLVLLSFASTTNEGLPKMRKWFAV